MRYLNPCGKTLLLSAAAMLLAFGLISGWRWYWLPYAEVNPKHWAGRAITYAVDSTQLTLWLHRRHAAMLSLAQAYVMLADDKTIPVRLTAISYPTLYPEAIRVDFELVNATDTEFVHNQQGVILRRQQQSAVAK